MQILRMFNHDYTFSICEINLLQIAQHGFLTPELVGNLNVFELHLKKRMQAGRRDLRDPRDDPAFQAHSIESLVCLQSETRLEKRWVKHTAKLTNVQSVDIPDTMRGLGYYIWRYFRRGLHLGSEDTHEDIDN
ncbi:hypothetical protein P167DRAFT_577081 [Morchella conica CCBAS932]|uniref:Uncharacterized protein n=1 Tax=Morchella conica CCBAS932 TaxID=1392247 RepID=A0A3N4KGG5_9PEZI|nr:hypothetical protein P167DRAFT_577081 [Morchella conica CCBAS932]